MAYAYIYDSDKTRIADAVVKKIKPEVDALKRQFTAVSDKQQEQLDRIEGQLAELLAILKPESIDKPKLVTKREVGVDR